MRIPAVSNNYLYGKIASGKRIQSAADDAAGLSIANKMKRESNGLDVSADNIKDGIGVANIKDGALDSMQSSLHRIYELSIKASNSMYGDSEKRMIQDEVDQLLQDIESTAVGTKYNEMKLMDGSMADMGLATNPNGGGMKIQMANSTLEALGIADLDVTSADFSLDAIDKALKTVTSQRGNLGAFTNRLEHTFNYNTRASLEQLGSRSRLEDLDLPKAVSEKKKQEVLVGYKNFMMREQMNQQNFMLRMFQ